MPPTKKVSRERARVKAAVRRIEEARRELMLVGYCEEQCEDQGAVRAAQIVAGIATSLIDTAARLGVA